MKNYKWKPTKAQKKQFAQKMQDPIEQQAYQQRKENRLQKNRSESQFNYNTAGGYYIATYLQHETAFIILRDEKSTIEQKDAANMVINSYLLTQKIHHDFIHIINEYYRSNN